MNDFTVFNVDIDKFFFRRVHIDVHYRNVGDLHKRKDVHHGKLIDANFSQK